VLEDDLLAVFYLLFVPVLQLVDLSVQSLDVGLFLGYHFVDKVDVSAFDECFVVEGSYRVQSLRQILVFINLLSLLVGFRFVLAHFFN